METEPSSAAPKGLPAVGSLVGAGWDLLRQHFKSLIWLFLPPMVLSTIGSYLTDPDLGIRSAGETTFGWLISLVSFVWLMWATLVMVNLFMGRVTDLKESYRQTGPRVLGLFGVSILYALATAAGLIFLVIPGILIGTWYSQVAFVYAAEGTGVLDAFTRSKAMVADRFWPVFGRFALLWLIMVGGMIVISIVVGALSFMLGSWLFVVVGTLAFLMLTLYAYTYSYELYRQLTHS